MNEEEERAIQIIDSRNMFGTIVAVVLFVFVVWGASRARGGWSSNNNAYESAITPTYFLRDFRSRTGHKTFFAIKPLSCKTLGRC